MMNRFITSARGEDFQIEEKIHEFVNFYPSSGTS